MNKEELLRKVAYLEFVNDQLLTELKYVDQLLCQIGFPEGLETVKIAALELQEASEEEEEHNDRQDLF